MNSFIYQKYTYENKDEYFVIKYYYEIKNIETFIHQIKVPKKIIKNKGKNFEKIIFELGIMEMINYYKLTLSKEIIIKCGFLNQKQKAFFKKTFKKGLSELLYRNKIKQFNFSIQTLSAKRIIKEKLNLKGNLIPVGGGKDSCVTLELLKNESCTAILINPKEPMRKCTEISEVKKKMEVLRILDMEKLKKLNEQGYYNGHIPVSACYSFIFLFVAYISNLQNIVLSNEASTFESYVKNKEVNHQYSKSLAYENDFNKHINEFVNIKYFSFLRPLFEVQIAHLFSQMKKYHPIFKSCNLGSKGETWTWCNECAKCLFIYIILSPFLSEKEMINIFGINLLDKEDLKDIFIELIGKGKTKPFECVGTFKEINYALNLTIKKYKKPLPFLLDLYYNKYMVQIDENLLNNFSPSNLDEKYEKILKEALLWKTL
jgi:hypothetical protein